MLKFIIPERANESKTAYTSGLYNYAAASPGTVPSAVPGGTSRMLSGDSRSNSFDFSNATSQGSGKGARSRFPDFTTGRRRTELRILQARPLTCLDTTVHPLIHRVPLGQACLALDQTLSNS